MLQIKTSACAYLGISCLFSFKYVILYNLLALIFVWFIQIRSEFSLGSLPSFVGVLGSPLPSAAGKQV
jgi:hypothetical protein